MSFLKMNNFKIILALSSLLVSQNTLITPDVQRRLLQAGISLDQINQATELINTEALDGVGGSADKVVKDGSDIKSDLKKIYKEEKSVNVNLIEDDNLIENVKSNETSSTENQNIDQDLETDKEIEEVEENLEIDEDLATDVNIEENILSDDIMDLYFGYNTFSGDPELFQASNSESVDPNYIIGPGDEIIIMLWGDTQLNRSYFVSMEGYVLVKDVGQIFVNGLTLESLEKKLFKIFKKAYSSLEPFNGNATTFFDVSLGALTLRPLRVFVAGEVKQPGAYSLKGASSLFTSLYYFNGPSISGSLRDIQVIRNGKKKGSIDYYDFLLTGKKLNDIRLNRDDVVFIPPRGKTVEAAGELMRPSIYELKNNEGFKEFLTIAGGLLPTTYSERIQIDRILPSKKRVSSGINRTLIDVSIDQILSSNIKYELYDGDKITFYSISDMISNSVTINGPVVRPGIYAVDGTTTVKDLIKKAEGLNGDAYLNKADIFRFNADFTKSQIAINIKKALEGDSDHNIVLLGNDSLVIYSSNEMVFKDDVYIEGHVLSPGRKSYFNNMTLYDLIFEGGGFHNSKHLSFTYKKRADLFRTNEDGITRTIISFNLDSVLIGQGVSNMPLKVGDKVSIYSLKDVFGLDDKYVTVKGLVKNPGEYPLYDSNMTIDDILFIAGGFDDPLFYSKVYVDRAEIIRHNKFADSKEVIVFRIDSLLSGVGLSGMLLKDKDEITIYSREDIEGRISPAVFIEGNVKFPGEYVLADENMTIYDLLFKSGGLIDENVIKNTYMHRIDLVRGFNQNFDKKIIPLSLKKIIKNKNNYDINKKLMTNDVVRVYKNSLLKTLSRCKIDGSILNPGYYEIKKGMVLGDLILESGGPISGDTLKNEIYYFKVEIARIDPNNTNEDFFAEIMEFELLNDESLFTQEFKSNFDQKYIDAADFKLVENDLVTIRIDPLYSRQKKVTIKGYVYNPGDYVIAGPNERLSDIIERAGGLRPEAYPIASSFIRNNNKIMLSFEKLIRSPKSSSNFKILEGDSIIINAKTNLVFVNGEVNNPGNYQFFKNSNVNDYIKMAGGLNRDASKYATYIELPNGMSEKVRFLRFSPRVYDGSTINIGRKEEVEKFSFTQYVTNLTGIYTDFMQAYLMLQLLAQNQN